MHTCILPKYSFYQDNFANCNSTPYCDGEYRLFLTFTVVQPCESNGSAIKLNVFVWCPL